MAGGVINNGVKKNRKFGKKRNFKINLVFDEEKRRDFLTGFHKRKLQRKKKAKEDLEKQLKEERKRLKQEAKQSYNKLVSHRPIPEIEHFLSEEHENDDVKVKIEEISVNNLADENNWIGANRSSCQVQSEEADVSDNSENEDLPGMELRQNKQKHQNKDKTVIVNSHKEFKKILKQKATKNVQNSKVFQQKSNLERNKQKKNALRQKNLKLKHQKKPGRNKHGK